MSLELTHIFPLDIHTKYLQYYISPAQLFMLYVSTHRMCLQGPPIHYVVRDGVVLLTLIIPLK